MTFNWRSVRHSAISNPSDFEEDEEAKDVGFVQHQRMWKVARRRLPKNFSEVDYLALELLHHLPSEKAPFWGRGKLY